MRTTGERRESFEIRITRAALHVTTALGVCVLVAMLGAVGYSALKLVGMAPLLLLALLVSL